MLVQWFKKAPFYQRLARRGEIQLEEIPIMRDSVEASTDRSAANNANAGMRYYPGEVPSDYDSEWSTFDQDTVQPNWLDLRIGEKILPREKILGKCNHILCSEKKKMWLHKS
ncbi:hypothetical protein M9Y10_040529 [Tritrichomonas musculus]|uniref:Uncharacterized protein n=1 Tax=Tritrichomonas musculus TaxID=1915356 RepID=A0ABR2GPW1_9EUKA